MGLEEEAVTFFLCMGYFYEDTPITQREKKDYTQYDNTKVTHIATISRG